MTTLTIEPLNLRIASLSQGSYVLQAFDAKGHEWLHDHIFDNYEGAARLYSRVADAHFVINTQHWSKLVPGNVDELIKAHREMEAKYGTGHQQFATPTTPHVGCNACGGSGTYRAEDADSAGVCYRCQGKGYQTVADQKRNLSYDLSH